MNLARTIRASAAVLALVSVGAAPVAHPNLDDPHGTYYTTVAPMNQTVERRIMPQLDRLLHKLIDQRRDTTLDGVRVFDAHDKFLPGKIAAGMTYLLLDTSRSSPKFDAYLRDYRAIADMTVDDDNESWGIYYYISALYKLKKAGLLDSAVSAPTLAKLRRKLDWRTFVDAKTMQPINLPNNYTGVAFSIARLRMLMGWEDASASDALLKRMIDHYRQYSGRYGFADETDGQGRFDRYSVLLAGEIAQRLIETGMAPPPELKIWLRKSAELMLLRLNMTGEGWEYGRSIGPYGETCFLEVLTAAAKFGVLSPTEERMAYAYSSRVAARYMDFWVNPETGSVNMWDKGRRTDAYRGKHRIFGENLSLDRQYLYTNEEWNELGFKDRAPAPDYAAWLKSLSRSTFTYFARDDYDRGLLTIRDRGHVIGLPLVNGAKGQHMHNPYFPIPASAGMLSGSADADYPLLVPRFTLADGSVLMPLAWFKQIEVSHQGDRTIVTYHMDAMDRMGQDAPQRDPRIRVTTRYVFSPGSITREDRYSSGGAQIDIAAIDLDFVGFSTAPHAVSPTEVAFAKGEVSRFRATGLGRCTAEPVDAPPFRAPSGALHSRVSCHRGAVELDAPLTIGWTLSYH